MTDQLERSRPAAGLGRECLAIPEYEDCPLWDTMKSHGELVMREMKANWPGMHDGVVRCEPANGRVTVRFSVPSEHRVSPEELQEFIQRHWETLSAPSSGGPVSVESVQVEAGSRAGL